MFAVVTIRSLNVAQKRAVIFVQQDEFDYIIVGAGSAGCVLADRLSRSGKYKVLLLESGGSDARFWIKVPIGYAINYANPALNWGFHTVADKGLAGRSVYWPRGKVIGGSSSINAMTYVRGLAHDFEDWAQAGALGFEWDEVLKVYERLETHAEMTTNGNRQIRGRGRVWVSDLSDQMSPFSQTFLDAAAEMKLPVIKDLNAPNSDGIGFYRSTVKNGYRWSSADAFLRPAKRRGNLMIVKHAHADRLHFDGERVTGLQYARKGHVVTVTAQREVIVSAGAINSPKLLQLSGFGPAKLLAQYGIKVMRDLPQVGRGLQDHLAIGYQFRANRATLNAVLGSPLGRLRMGAKYLLTRKGPLSVPVNQVGGFVRSNNARTVPDIQLYFNPASYEVSGSGKTQLDRQSGYLISAQPCRPTSRGYVEIVSPSPNDAPRIVPNSLSTEADKETAVRGARILQQFAKTQSLKAVTIDAKPPDLNALDDAALLRDFQSRASTVYHPTCTCRIGWSAQKSVLDARLRVHGVAGLRVVDASAFPNITSGNTNAPTMMLAMKAADYILEDADKVLKEWTT